MKKPVSRQCALNVVLALAFFSLPLNLALADNQEKRGWNWYEDPQKEEEVNPDFAVEPTIPAYQDLQKMRPAAIGKLMEDQLAFGIVSEDVSEVAEYYQLMDFARRRSRTFTALTGMAMLKNPDLNARSQYPVTNAGRTVRSKGRKQDRDHRLRAEQHQFALIMFSSQGCGYCDIQWGILQAFKDRMGWNISKIDIADYPERATRFNVQGTPMTIMIRKDSQDWFPVSVGAESLPALADNTYRAVRLLLGEISNQQFLTNEGDNGGFFDPSHVARAGTVDTTFQPLR